MRVTRVGSLTVALPLVSLLAGCGGGGNDMPPPPAAAAPSQAAATSPASLEAGTSVVAASPGCEDRAGDSTAALDLTSVALDVTKDEVLFVYTYRGGLPAAGSLLLSTLGGSKQYGYKMTDGQKSSHFVFDFATSLQENVEAEAVVRPTEATIAFPLHSVAVDSLDGGTATLTVDGQDVDSCDLRNPS